MAKIRKIVLLITVFAILFFVQLTEVAAAEVDYSKRIRIGISYTPSPGTFSTVIKKAGAVPVKLPLITTEEEAEELLKSLDALIMSGGEDIHPSYYGEEPSEFLGKVNDARDISDMVLLRKALEMDMPVLCVCRGTQVLNVVQGGTLYQDIPTELGTDVVHRVDGNSTYHNVFLDEGTRVYELFGQSENRVYSSHHQAVDDLGENLKVIGRSSDGIIEAVEMTNKTYVIGLQFHPEIHSVRNEWEQLNFFEALEKEGARYRKEVVEGLKFEKEVRLSLYGHDDVKAEWDEVAGANGYAVYYRTGKQKYKLLNRTENLSIKKSGLSDGKKYDFKVVPYVKRGDRFYEASEITEVSIYTLKKMDKPVIARETSKTVKVTWKDISGEKGYQISQSEKKDGTKIVASSANAFKEIKTEKRKTYYYKVRAYQVADGKKIYGSWSEPVSYKMK